MHFTRTAVLGLFACLVQGAKIGKDAEDGLYTFELNDAGEEIPKLIARHDNGDGSFMRRRTLDERNDCPTTPFPEGKVGCEGQGIDYSELSTAQSNLESFCGCDAALDEKKVFYKKGNAVAYTCRYTKSNTCNKSEAQAAWSMIAGNCGTKSAPRGGWYWLKDWEKNYGYTDGDSEFCTNL